jgi:hypothetical protein
MIERVISSGYYIDDSPTILLLNPLTRVKLYLPSLFSFPNVVNFNLGEVDKEYTIQGVANEIYQISLREMRNMLINKILLLPGLVNNSSSFKTSRCSI